MLLLTLCPAVLIWFHMRNLPLTVHALQIALQKKLFAEARASTFMCAPSEDVAEADAAAQ